MRELSGLPWDKNYKLNSNVTHDKGFSANLLIFPHGTLILHEQSARKIVKLNNLALKYKYVRNITL